MTAESSSALLAVPGESPERSPLASPVVYTPPSDSSAIDTENNLPKRRPSPLDLPSRGREAPLPVSGDIRFTGSRAGTPLGSAKPPLKRNGASDFDSDSDEEEEMAGRPPLHRPTDGRSETPLLKDERGRSEEEEEPLGSARPAFVARRSTFRSRSPDHEAQSATKRKYIYAAFFLGLSLVSFVVQTETATYVTQELGWKKSYCML